MAGNPAQAFQAMRRQGFDREGEPRRLAIGDNDGVARLKVTQCALHGREAGIEKQVIGHADTSILAYFAQGQF
jgi:hypothetical protein